MEVCFKILRNSFYESTLTDKTRFRDIRIFNSRRQSFEIYKITKFS